MPTVMSIDRCGENIDAVKVASNPKVWRKWVFRSDLTQLDDEVYVATTRSDDGTVVDMQTFEKKGRIVLLK